MLDVVFFFIKFFFYLSRRRIMSCLNPNAKYEELVSVRLVGMMLTVIVRQELRKNVLRYSTQAVGTGALNFMVTFPVSPPPKFH